MTLIIDSHLDLAWNALQWNRDITQSVYTLRSREAGEMGKEKGRGMNTVCLPDMGRGRVCLCFATLLARSTGNAKPHIDYATPMQAYATAQGQLAYYRALENSGHIRIIHNLNSLNAHILDWERWEQNQSDPVPPVGFVVSMESADPILLPEDLGQWKAAGVRVIGPAHYGMGRYAGGTSVEDGLTDIGIRLLEEMEQHSVSLDMTHLSDKAFWQALDHYEGVVIASHNNCRRLVPHQRQFSDEQLTAIIQRGGVIGVAFDAWMLRLDWQTHLAEITLSTVVDHIDHICQLAGNSQHAAIGSDLDGGFGREQSPADLDTIADLQDLIPLLENRGYTQPDIAAILHGNWLRILRQCFSK